MLDNWPNRLTLLRFIIVPLMVATYWFMPTPLGFAIMFVAFVIGSLTDYLDGILARRLDQVTAIGRSMDPIADKLLVLTAILILFAAQQAPFLPCVVIVCREVFVSGLRESLLEQRNDATLPVSTLAKYKTTAQMIAICVLFAAGALPSLPWLAHIGESAMWIAAILSITTAVDYGMKAFRAFHRLA